MNAVAKMKALLTDSGYPWEYGTVNLTFGEVKARRHMWNGNVQFVLWSAGEQGHKEDYWHDMNSFWWPEFKSYQKKK